MKAYQVGPTGGWVLEEIEERALGANEVRVALRAASLNYRDVLVASGKYGPKLPVGLVPVSDGAGVIVEVGSEVSRWKVGDEVIGCFFDRWTDGLLTPEKSRTARGGAVSGVLSERFISHEEGLVAKPKNLSFAKASTLPCAAVTAWTSLFVAASVRPGQTVLLQGTGGVSIFALQLAHQAGVRTVVTSSSHEKLERAKTLGADHVLNYIERPDWDKAALELVPGGVDAILEVGGAGTLAKSLKAIRYGGHISIIGVLAGLNAEVSIGMIQAKNARLEGIFVGSRSNFEGMLKVPLAPVIDTVFGFDEAPRALEALQEAKHFGKLVIELLA